MTRRKEKQPFNEGQTTNQVGAVAYSPETRRQSRRSFLERSWGFHRSSGRRGGDETIQNDQPSNETQSNANGLPEQIASGGRNNETLAEKHQTLQNGSVETQSHSCEIDKNAEDQRNNRRKFLLCFLISCLALIAIVIGVSVAPSEKPKSDNNAGNVVDTGDFDAGNVDSLVVFSVENILPNYTAQALRDPSSPQSAALNWLKKDPLYPWYTNDDSKKILTRFALATLYFSTNGDNWIVATNWLSYEVDHCKWYTAVNLGPCRYLDLYSNGLDGEIPPEIGLLTSLIGFSLAGNNLSGPIPSQLGLLTRLTYFRMYDNSLTGTVPKEIFQFSRTLDIRLHNNFLSGTIPTEIGQIFRTRDINLFSNNLTGTIPTEIGLLQNLIRIDLSNNALTGPIPTEFGRLTNYITRVDTSHNNLSGPIPTELGMLARDAARLQDIQVKPADNMQYLDISFNNLTSTLPPEIFLLHDLQTLYIQSNSLTGRIPNTIAGLTQVKLVNMSENNLNGQLPYEIGLLSNLEMFSVFDNHLTGVIPSEFGLLNKLQDLDVHNNSLLSGAVVPSELCGLFDLASLTRLAIDCNRIDCSCDCSFGVGT